QFLRAKESLLDRNRRAEILVIGGEEVSYGSRHPSGRSWREVVSGELQLDTTRIHFLGKKPYARYLAALQVSSVHVYVTAPSVPPPLPRSAGRLCLRPVPPYRGIPARQHEARPDPLLPQRPEFRRPARLSRHQRHPAARCRGVSPLHTALVGVLYRVRHAHPV